MTPNTEARPVLPPDVRTLVDLFRWRVATTPAAEAYRHHDATQGAWVGTTWAECGQLVSTWVRALRRLGLPAGARVATLLPNGLDAVCADLAALSCGLVPLPLHALDNPSSIAYILADSEAALLIAATPAQWRGIEAQGPRPATLRHVFVATAEGEGAEATLDDIARPLAEWLSAAPGEAAAATHEPSEGDLAALVYTSGTTGKPKGVMLSHRNVVANVVAALARVAAHEGDRFLSFLPLSHTFERTAGYYLPMAAGACVAFARSTALLAEDMLSQRPTILIAVPRIFERVQSRLQETIAGSTVKSFAFESAQAVGWRRFERRQGAGVAGRLAAVGDALAWPLLDALVARPLRQRFGGRLRIAVSGGAPLSIAVARCFLSLEIDVLQGYGMTEAAPVVAVNTPDDNEPTTVGRPLPGVEVRIAEVDKELLVRGPNVMLGYWKRPDDTARALVDGWLRTGDQAAIESGRIRIVGRVKEIIVTSTGEKIAPVDLELAITADPLFEQAYVVGEGRPFIACVVVLNRARWARLAGALGLAADAAESLHAPAARAAVLQQISGLTKSFPYYAQPRAVELELQAWSVENGLMTPTLKLKRRNLETHFEAAIKAMYAHRAPPG